MKRATVLAIATAALLVGGQSFALSAEEILAKCVEATGGTEKIEAQKTRRLTGYAVMQGTQMPFTVSQKRPNLYLFQTNIQGMDIVQAFDGKDAWNATPMTGGKARPMPAEQARTFRNQVDFDGPLIGLTGAGFSVELIGPAKVDGKDAHHLVIVGGSDSLRAEYGGLKTHVYVDATTFLICKVSVRGVISGNEFAVDNYFTQYKEVAGVMLAHSVEARVEGMSVSTMITEKVEVNIELDDAAFRMPGK